MSKQLIESIIDKDYVTAESYFHDKLNLIMEQKLYEEKRRVSAEMNEIFGGMTKKEIEDKRKAGYRRASEVLGDPGANKLSTATKKYRESQKKKKVSEETLDEAGLAPTDIGKRYRSGLRAGKLVATSLAGIRKGYRKQQASVGQSDKWSTAAAGSEPSHPKQSTTSDGARPKTPWLRRNVNTALGRDPDYDPKAPENQSRGGRVGKAARFVGKTIVSDLLALAESKKDK